MEVSNGLDSLMIARRLLMHAQRAEDRRKGKNVAQKSLKDEMDEDQALISGNAPVEKSGAAKAAPKADEVRVKLADVSASLKEGRAQPEGTAVQQVQISIQTQVERQASFSYSVLEKVDGLVRNSQTQAETDRYRFDFSDGTTFTITDKWSNRATTIWGDPHVDVSDVAGDRDGDFQDLKGSDAQTTMMLQDGTRVTFSARDSGVIEGVDIFKDSQHLGGIGAASTQWNENDGLFARPVDENAASVAGVPMGDTVYAGGDGNDWFTSDGKLLWGKTTAAPVTTRPYAIMQLEYREQISQQVSVQVINQQA